MFIIETPQNSPLPRWNSLRVTVDYHYTTYMVALLDFGDSMEVRVFEASSYTGNHGTITTHEGQVWGDITTRRAGRDSAKLRAQNVLRHIGLYEMVSQ